MICNEMHTCCCCLHLNRLSTRLCIVYDFNAQQKLPGLLLVHKRVYSHCLRRSNMVTPPFIPFCETDTYFSLAAGKPAMTEQKRHHPALSPACFMIVMGGKILLMVGRRRNTGSYRQGIKKPGCTVQVVATASKILPHVLNGDAMNLLNKTFWESKICENIMEKH